MMDINEAIFAADFAIGEPVLALHLVSEIDGVFGCGGDGFVVSFVFVVAHIVRLGFFAGNFRPGPNRSKVG